MNCCDEYGNCTQGRNCPVRKKKEPMSTVEFISKAAIAAALIAAWAYLLAECMA